MDVTSDEKQTEGALRPKLLAEFVGQNKVKNQLALLIQAAKIQGRVTDHALLAGPPGLGKTTLAMIVAAECGVSIRMSSGPAIQHAGDLAALLSSLLPGELLFIDEIHRMSRVAEEMLYLAMEDFRIDIMVGKGPGATSVPLELSPFTLVGATTRAGLLPGPLRDRFGFTARLDFYSPEELLQVLIRSARLMEIQYYDDALESIAVRSRGTPRVANRLLRRTRDYLLVSNSSEILSKEIALKAMDVYEVDSLGLDRLDRAVLHAIFDSFSGGPVGIKTLSAYLGEEAETIENSIEPFLVRQGLLVRTPRGRQITDLARKHMGFKEDLSGFELYL